MVGMGRGDGSWTPWSVPWSKVMEQVARPWPESTTKGNVLSQWPRAMAQVQGPGAKGQGPSPSKQANTEASEQAS